MKFDFKNFAALLDSAGITAIEAARIFKTTRTTIYHWRGGNEPNQEVLLMFACSMIRVIQKAVEAGELPLKDVLHVDRKAVLSEVIKRNMR